MYIEYQALALLSIFFVLAWLPVSAAKYETFGLKWLLSNRRPVEGKQLDSWGARCERAHNNLKDNFPAFVAAILLLGTMERFDNHTAIASVIYVVARFGHYLSYGIGNVLARAIFYFSGLIANIYLLIKVLI